MAEEATVIGRLKVFIDSLGYSNSQFADKAGIPRPTLSQLVHGRNKSVSDTLLRKLYDSFPSLNITWLLFGQGNMLTDSNIETSKPQMEPRLPGIEEQDADSQQLESFLRDVEDDSNATEAASIGRETASARTNSINFDDIATTYQQKFDSQGVGPINNVNSSSDNLRRQSDVLNDIVMPRGASSANDNIVNAIETKGDKKIKSIIVLYTDSSFEVFSSES